MSNIQLPLTQKWFDKTKKGGKKEDYRAITPYFCNRFLLYKNEHKSKKWWGEWLKEQLKGNWTISTCLNCNILCDNIQFKHFESNVMTLGYPNSSDTEKILCFEHRGIDIRGGRECWGALKGVSYFVVKHGKRIN